MSALTQLKSDALRCVKAETVSEKDIRDYGEEKAKLFAQIAEKSARKNATKVLRKMKELLEDEEYGTAMLELMVAVKQGQQKVNEITMTRQWYIISIRPDDSKAHFIDFKEKVEEFITRKCFIKYYYSFEQKGVDKPEEMGKGFHVHIVAEMKQRSKSEVLRDSISSWKDWIGKGLITENNIHVGVTKNPKELVQNYLLEYKSDDDHKAATKDYDHQWRQAIGLYNLYTSEETAQDPSP